MDQDLRTGIKLLNSMTSLEAQLIICQYDHNKNEFAAISANSYRVFGYKPSEMIGRPASYFTEGTNDEEMAEAIEMQRKGNPLVDYFVNVYIHKDTKKGVMMLWGSDQKNKDGISLSYGLPVTPDMLELMNVLKYTL